MYLVELYIDILFFVNFTMDFLILLIVWKILKWNSKVIRIVLAAATGSTIACIFAILPSLYGLFKFMIAYLFTCILMIWLAFKVKKFKDLCKGAIILSLVTFCMGGLISSCYYQRKTIEYYLDMLEVHLFSEIKVQYVFAMALLGAFIMTVAINTMRKHKQLNKEIYAINLTWEQASIEAKGLVDTGNCLYDPITGKPVIVVEMGLMRECFRPSLYEDLKRITRLEDGDYHISDENLTKIRLIPFQSIGKKRGILPAIVLDEVMIQKDTQKICSKHVVAAIYDDILSQKNEYQVILHKSLL